ncbi:hypothetical protein ACFU7D_27825, partial [Nocardioides sp. NPDC057577]|uniref:hypothetical protein n=1 Tax=Nocardioides sp. NPDC057577 TaxID=3346171 RepID=UPI0036718454
MSKSVSHPAHRGAPRPFRSPNVSIARTIAGSLRAHGKFVGRVTLASGIAAGALVAVPAANAAPVSHETSTVEPAKVVEAPTLEASATPTAMLTDIKQLERAVEVQERKAEA